MNYAELITRDVKDLRHLAAQYGIKTGPRSKAETIAKLIVEHITAKPQQAMQHPAEHAKEPLRINTEEEVRDVIKHFTAKESFQVQFPGDNTWIFKCRGSEESGHMSVPLRVIRSKAESVSRGALNPRGLKDNPINPTPNSGIVLMV